MDAKMRHLRIGFSLKCAAWGADSVRPPNTVRPELRLAILIGTAAFAACTVCCTTKLLAQYREAFEGPETSWQLADRDCTVQFIEHRRSFEKAHAGQGCEYLHFRADHGSFVHFAHAIPASRLIDELTAGVWIRSNRSGLQLMIRVVLPRSTDPRTGETLKTLIRGNSYRQMDGWSRLSVERPHQQLVEQLPLLRSQFGSDVNAREAYADLVVLNAYGGRGVTEISIDDLELSGQVAVDSTSDPATIDQAGSRQLDSNSMDPADPNARVQLVGAQLLLGGKPWLPRVIQHNGEPLSWLKSQGFNAIKISTPPTPELVREAETADMWIVAPPRLSLVSGKSETISPRILAWNLGEGLDRTDYESVQRATQRLKGSRGTQQPLLICSPSTEIRSYSRVTDLISLEPPHLSGSLPLQDLGKWYLQRSRLAREGTPFWATVDTQVSSRVTQQMRLMGAAMQVPLMLEPAQIRLAAFHAIASGARGILFRSTSPLNRVDRFTQIRARGLQQLNQDLKLLEPWATTGIHDAEIEASDPTVRISVLKTDRSRLVLAIRRQPDQQFIAGRTEPGHISFSVHGVSETDEIYRIAADGLHRLRQQRGTGMQIGFETADVVNAVVLTQDRLVINYLARHVTQNRRQNDRLAAEVAANLYASVVDTHQRLLPLEPAVGAANDSLEQARAQLQHYERLIEGGGHERAEKYLTRGLQQLASMRYDTWRPAVDSFLSPVASPLCISFFALPYHYALASRLQDASWGPNMLPGGDFESLAHLQANQWHHYSHSGGAESAVELSLHAPRNGRSSLRLQAWPRDPARPAVVVDAPPLSIVSGPVPVTAGEILQIRGWVRVAEPIHGSLEGLLVYDSLAGPDLAHRIRQTGDWTEFTLYRAAAETGDMTVTFSLSGFGEAWIDNVTVHSVSASSGSMVQRRGEPRR